MSWKIHTCLTTLDRDNFTHYFLCKLGNVSDSAKMIGE